MKLIKSKFSFIFFGVFIFLFLFSCGPSLQHINTEDYIQFVIKEINFEKGNWDFYKDAGYDTLKLTNMWISNFQRTLKVNYDENNNPYVPFFDDTILHTYKNNGFPISVSSFFTLFYNNYYSTILHNNAYDYNLKNGYINYLSYSYNSSGQSFVDITGGIGFIGEEKIFRINDPDGKFDADVEIIKRANLTNDFKKTINLVVMADGYTDREIRDFETYTRDAFKDTASFHYREDRNTHYPITNKFFDRFWDDYINVVMVKTISKDSGVDTDVGINRKDTIFDVNVNLSINNHLIYGDKVNINKVMGRNFEKIGLHPSYVDVIIILVNQQGAGAYASVQEIGFGDRNFQPINRTIISAPAGYWVNQTNFHTYVRTSAIAHELGHTLARLADEYDIGNNRIYDPRRRNIDLIENINYPKWHNLNSQYFFDSVLSVPTSDRDHRVGNFIGAFYNSTDYIRPTFESTMRGQNPSRDYQFGPVNTYHLTGSFYTRMGIIDPQDPGYREIGVYEWRGYSFLDFSREWPTSNFY